MHRRAFLRRSSAAGLAGLAGCVGTTVETIRPTPDPFMSFAATHPADRSLVVGGLTVDDDADRYGRLFTARPESAVFTDDIEDESPYMRSQVRKDRYDSRFLIVAELRRDAPFTLRRAFPDGVRWSGPETLSVAMEATPDDDPSAELRGVEVVSTALLIFEHYGTRPETVTMPVSEQDGESLGTIVASPA